MPRKKPVEEMLPEDFDFADYKRVCTYYVKEACDKAVKQLLDACKLNATEPTPYPRSHARLAYYDSMNRIIDARKYARSYEDERLLDNATIILHTLYDDFVTGLGVLG